jgi:NADH:ubiquinone oxidoreductase subunit H
VVKFWLKETSRHWRGSGGLGIALALGSYLGWSLISAVFLVAGGGVAVIDFWDFHLLTYAAYANLTTTFLAHLAAATRSKYATAASARTVLLAAYLEVFFAAAMLIVYAHSGGYSLEALHAADTWLIVALPPVALTLSVFAVFEAKRAPYDHSEAESELVAGHLVEYGGRSLLLFFVCEYIHLYVCVAYITVVILGGTGDFGLA